MNELMLRRRALMGAQGEGSGPVWLFNNGVTSSVAGGWNNAGYKYGSTFAQAITSNSLHVYSTNKYNTRGGRTYTTNNVLPANLLGKTLVLKGTLVTSDVNDNRNCAIYLYISETVTNASTVESVPSSGAFTNEIHRSKTYTIQDASGTDNFEIRLPITQTGYVSLVGYKGYTGTYHFYFKEVYAE